MPRNHPRVPADLCKGGAPNACWFSAVVSVISTDGGKHFRRVTSPSRPNGIVAASPIPYRPDIGVQGSPAHRNIVEKGGWYYMMPASPLVPELEKGRGKTVWRTGNISDFGSWRGWNGSAFSVRSFDPYTEPALSAGALLAATPMPVNTGLSGSLSYLPTVDAFVIVGTKLNQNKLGEVVYQSSKDLITWSDPVSLFNVTHHVGIRDGKGALYPTILDPQSKRQNFDHFEVPSQGVGSIYWLEFACEEPTGACWERDVVRRPLRLVVDGVAA